MITKSTNHLDNLLVNGYDFDFGSYISEGFAIVNKNIGGFIGYTFIYLATTMVLGLIPGIGSIANLLISPPLTAGFYIVANKIRNGEEHQFGDFFKGFDFFGPLVGASLLTFLIILVIIIPVGVIAFLSFDMMAVGIDDDMPVGAILVILLALIPILYLSVAYTWASMLIIFYNYSAWEAMEMSRKLITKKWFSVFIFLLITALISAAGLLLVGVGFLYTLPVFMCASYVAFAKVTAGEEIDDVMDHLVE